MNTNPNTAEARYSKREKIAVALLIESFREKENTTHVGGRSGMRLQQLAEEAVECTDRLLYLLQTEPYTADRVKEIRETETSVEEARRKEREAHRRYIDTIDDRMSWFDKLTNRFK